MPSMSCPAYLLCTPYHERRAPGVPDCVLETVHAEQRAGKSAIISSDSESLCAPRQPQGSGNRLSPVSVMPASPLNTAVVIF